MRSPVVVMICLFVLGATFWCTPTREAATLLGCRALTAGGYLGSVRVFLFHFSFISESVFFCYGCLLTDSFYSSQVFLVIDLSDQSLRLDQVPALFETNGTVPLSGIVARCFVTFLSGVASQCSLRG